MPTATEKAPTRSTGSALLRRKVSRRVKFVDKAATTVIRTCGLGIIAIVTLIFVFIGLESLPLFRGATQEQLLELPLPNLGPPGDALALGVDEYEAYIYHLDSSNGTIHFLDASTHLPAGSFPLASLARTRATAAYRTPGRDRILIGTADGRVVVAQARFAVDYAPDGKRTITPSARELGRLSISPDEAAITVIHGRQNSAGDYPIVAATATGRVFLARFVEDEPAEDPVEITGPFSSPIAALSIDQDAEKLFIAETAPRLHQYYVDESTDTPFRSYDLPSAITAMDYIIGDIALVMGFADGSVESWFGVRENPQDYLKPIHRIHTFAPMPAAVTCIQPSARDKGFVVGSADGTVKLNFTTSERTMLTDRLAAAPRLLAYSPKLTAILALDTQGTLRMNAIHNPHPEVSVKSLFGKVHYENYDQPEFIWQSTGGTDDFESKLSLVPLAVGTIKGALYGLLFAVPVAVFAGLYTSQFMAPQLRRVIKPTVEIMAALPSVVIGFLAGLWLAPLLERVMVGTLLSLIVVPVVVMTGAAIWTGMRREIRDRVPDGMELFLAIPLVVLGFWIAQQLGPVAEAAFFGGDYRQWVFEVFGRQFEQRNSVVIGIAMGFAVIPVIFTISEDAFSNVPSTFKSASYAVGASKWQTAWRVILPTASPGVFSAVMIGFGRAVGETMIVLMATGNTPILSFSPFNGMRTLSANIAVEIPEAPVAGTLYRVLFVAALLLFALTFLCNTVAEIVRQHLREKYKAV